MPRLIPDQPLERITNIGEQAVARALLQQLDEECLVYHSYPWLRPDRDLMGWPLRVGEADFVVLDPMRGLLVIEVKGKAVYDHERRLWFYDRARGLEEMRDPFVQASNNLFKIRELILEQSFPAGASFPCIHGYLVIFADREVVGPPPPGADKAVVLGQSALAILGQHIRQAFARWGGEKIERIPADTFRRLKEGLSRPFRLVQLLSSQVKAQEEILVRLTDAQERLLSGLRSHSRVRVAGVAGSGKTLIGLARARQFALKDQSTLFLCFNSKLAEWLGQRVPSDLRDRLEVFSFWSLVLHFIKKWQPSFRVPDDQDAWEAFFMEQGMTLFDQAANRVKKRYDAVVVDEAQDFKPDWWERIELLNKLKEKGPLYVFYDPDQILFSDAKDVFLPDLPTHFDLDYNCRNTRAIVERCSQLLGRPLLYPPETPPATRPSCGGSRIPRNGKQRCLAQVQQWLVGGLSPRQIAILSPWKREKSSLAGINSIAGKSLTTSLDVWQDNGGILMATIRSFKGLEADALLLTDIIAPEKSKLSNADLYVACSSRGRHLLTVLTAEPVALLGT